MVTFFLDGNKNHINISISRQKKTQEIFLLNLNCVCAPHDSQQIRIPLYDISSGFQSILMDAVKLIIERTSE